MATLPVSSEPFGAQPTPPPLPRSHTLAYVGPTGTMFGIFYKNLILTILTLGIYRFWAKTRLRRFQWANTQIDGEGFEYTGTGKELFLGFLKAVLILAPLFIGLQLIELFLIGQSMIAVGVLNVARAILVIALIYAGTFSARKYRMSRTTWRGIRFQQTGSMWRYAGIALLGMLLTPLTLGLYLPFLETQLMRYETDNLRFGSARFTFTGRGKVLFKQFLLVWGAFVLVAICVAAWGVGDMVMRPGPVDPQKLSALAFIPFLLIMIMGPLFLWYQGRAARFRAENTHVEGISFAMPRISGWQIFKLMFGNWFIAGISFGILYPLTIQRTIRFWVRHLQILGNIDLATVAQAERGPSTGEGLAGFFDIDLG
jgi:uncharacterized membrane protein YjgN (DUF898 family)